MLYSELSQYTHEQLSEFTYEQLSLLPQNGLVTNRTLDDVRRWMELRDKGWDKMTEDERLEWMGERLAVPSAARGMYTHKDLNRVERAVKEIVNRFKDIGYSVPEMEIIINRTHESKFRDSDIERYFRNISIVREILTVYPYTPLLPYVWEPLNYKRANDLEKILIDVDEIFTKLTQSWHYAGEIFTGEV